MTINRNDLARLCAAFADGGLSRHVQRLAERWYNTLGLNPRSIGSANRSYLSRNTQVTLQQWLEARLSNNDVTTIEDPGACGALRGFTAADEGALLAYLAQPVTTAVRYFADDFNRANGPAGNGWSAGNIVGNALVIAPTVGAELIVNGSFTAWTGDNPDGWTVIGESLPNAEVSEVGPAQGHGGAGTGACNLYADGVAGDPYIYQGIFTAGRWYLGVVDLTFYTSGQLRWFFCQDDLFFTAAATYTRTGRAQGSALDYYRTNTAVSDVTIDNASAKQITRATMFSVREQDFTNAYAQADLTIATYGQAGVVLSVDSADIDDAIIAYHSRVNNRIYLIKYVGGVITAVANVAAAYVAGAPLRLTRAGTSYTVAYNGVNVIAAAAIADAVFADARHWGVFSASGSNSVDDYVWEAT